MNKTYSRAALLMLMVLPLVFAASCGKGQEEVQPTLEEAKTQAKEAIESAEILLQGARSGTDLSDARELLDQARTLYGKAAGVEDFIGPDRSVLLLVEEAKRRALQAMEAEKL